MGRKIYCLYIKDKNKVKAIKLAGQPEWLAGLSDLGYN